MRVPSPSGICWFCAFAILASVVLAFPTAAHDPLQTQLEQELSTLLTNEVSGHTIAFEPAREIYTGSDRAAAALNSRSTQWRLCRDGLSTQIRRYARSRSSELGVAPSGRPRQGPCVHPVASMVPSIGANVEDQVSYLSRYDPDLTYLEGHSDTIAEIDRSLDQTRCILNFSIMIDDEHI